MYHLMLIKLKHQEIGMMIRVFANGPYRTYAPIFQNGRYATCSWKTKDGGHA